MRALLVANPVATTTDDALRDAVLSRLRTRFDHVALGLTKQRGHALHLVAGAVHDEVDAVFALGGDGTANEVLQRLAGTEVAFCHVPGGGTNVLARALGAPREPMAAVEAAIAAIDDPPRWITLGRANGRWFGAAAGYGFDAAVVKRVEQRRLLKRHAKQLAYVWAGFAEWFHEGAGIPADVWATVDADGPGEPLGPYAIGVVGNGDPYTWLGSRALRVTPDARFDAGLDLVGVRSTSTAGILRIIARAFAGGRHLADPCVDAWHDLDEVTLSADRPLPLMVDGDFAGDHHAVTFTAVRHALRVLA